MNRRLIEVAAVSGALLLFLALVLSWPDPDPAPDQPSDPTSGALPDPTLPPAPTPPSGTPLPSPSGPGGPAPSCVDLGDAARLTVLTFNIHGGFTAEDRYDLARIAAEIEAWRADVVLLQEVDRGRSRSGGADQAAQLGARLGMSSVFGPNIRSGGGQYGTAILSRFPIVSWAHQLLPRYAGQEQRGVLRATVQLLDQRIDVVNVHLEHTSSDVRVAQMRAVKKFIGPAVRPVVLGGDFNDPPGTRSVRLGLAGMQDTWPAVGSGDGDTVPAASPRRRIDYLLVSPQLTPTAAQVLRSAISDHRAVRGEYDVQRPDGCD
ncbi:endonuclease/exonuclease/phosphatase family protein [Nocardioides sp. SYSU D00038]|uniref:endonuclease/exonuclease/phosphatase family protein n=1 Tax=Nocardioides sp. SYSU D00038 TaxID=2812554 RepID=UPI0019684E81|nr:endonuclease/exonuclease/phosphatase family protein [Nocardioides sp. SYSU D00038]